MKNTTTNGYEMLIDKGILIDLPNMLFDVYEKETGKDPVKNEGGHTDEFEAWYISLCHRAWDAGISTPEGVAEFARHL